MSKQAQGTKSSLWDNRGFGVLVTAIVLALLALVWVIFSRMAPPAHPIAELKKVDSVVATGYPGGPPLPVAVKFVFLQIDLPREAALDDIRFSPNTLALLDRDALNLLTPTREERALLKANLDTAHGREHLFFGRYLYDLPRSLGGNAGLFPYYLCNNESRTLPVELMFAHCLVVMVQSRPPG